MAKSPRKLFAISFTGYRFVVLFYLFIFFKVIIILLKKLNIEFTMVNFLNKNKIQILIDIELIILYCNHNSWFPNEHVFEHE